MSEAGRPRRDGAPGAGAVDWQAAYRRLAELGESIDRPPSGEAVTAELARRAAVLAAAPEAPEARRDVVVFGLGDERYALEVDHAAGVVPIRDPVALPGLDPVHLGLIACRGALYALVDLNVLLDRPSPRAGPPAFAVLLDNPDCAVALAADVVHGTRAEPVGRLDAAGPHHAIIRAILADGAGLVAPDVATRNVRLVVDDRMPAAL